MFPASIEIEHIFYQSVWRTLCGNNEITNTIILLGTTTTRTMSNNTTPNVHRAHTRITNRFRSKCMTEKENKQKAAQHTWQYKTIEYGWSSGDRKTVKQNIY